MHLEADPGLMEAGLDGSTFGCWNLRKSKEAWEYLQEVLRWDVALLQEATPPAWATKHWRIIHRPKRSSAGWGCAIVVRRDWALTEVLPSAATPWLRSLSTWRCPAVVARLEAPVALWLASIHSDSRRVSRKQVLEAIGRDPSLPMLPDRMYEAELVAPEYKRVTDGQPCILGGDFNTAAELDPSEPRGAVFEENLYAAGLRELCAERTRTYNPGRDPVKPHHLFSIDRMFADSGLWAMPHAGLVLDPTGLSDHRPVEVTFHAT